MIRKHSLKQLYESRCKDSGGAGRFVRDLRYDMGLCDQQGRYYHDVAGNQVLQNPRDSKGHEIQRLRPTEFSLLESYHAIIGDMDVEQGLRGDRLQAAALVEQLHPLMEAGTGGAMASQFANISAWTGLIGGLLEVSVLEAFRNPAFIADQLMPVENTKMFDGKKTIGVTRIGRQAEGRLPGQPTRRARISERWITMPRTIERALGSEVYQETVYLDLTGQALSEASDVGTWLAYEKELVCIDAWLGVSTAPQYSYKGTTYAPYLTNGYFDNDVPNNELVHWTSVETAEIKFRDMKDPETNTRVLIQPDTVLVNREKLHTANSIFRATNIQYRDAPGSSTNPQQIREFANPLQSYAVLESPLVYERCTAADGLNLSSTVAGKTWWIFQKGKAIRYASNWPLRVQSAAPGQADMIDRGVVLFTKADERGTPFWQEPRYVVRNKP